MGHKNILLNQQMISLAYVFKVNIQNIITVYSFIKKRKKDAD